MADRLFPHLDEELKNGEPCDHPGCLRHVTHPCEGCGRIAGIPVVLEPCPNRDCRGELEITYAKVNRGGRHYTKWMGYCSNLECMMKAPWADTEAEAILKCNAMPRDAEWIEIGEGEPGKDRSVYAYDGKTVMTTAGGCVRKNTPFTHWKYVPEQEPPELGQ